MKLNLLPATVSRGQQTRMAWVIFTIICVVSVLLATGMIIKANGEHNDAYQAYNDALGPAQAAVAEAQKGDDIMKDPDLAAAVRNQGLAQAMVAHNDTYPNLYDSMLPYIPSFFRLTSMSAQPVGTDQAVVTLTGTLRSYQQYADLMLALMRNKNAVSVTRSGYVGDAKIVPSLVETDQTGRPRLPNQAPIPDNPIERLTYFESQGAQNQNAVGVGNFGSDSDATRTNMPGDSLVTVQIVVNGNIETPDPRATLAGGGGGSSPFGGGGMPPGVPGPPGGAGGFGPGGAGGRK